MSANILKSAKKRKPTQKQMMVNMMKDAGENGVTNKELSQVAKCYTARLSELRSVGYEYDVYNLGNGLTKYILRHEPEGEQKPVYQIDVVAKIIDSQYNGKVTSEQLHSILKEREINVVRKSRPYRR